MSSSSECSAWRCASAAIARHGVGQGAGEEALLVGPLPRRAGVLAADDAGHLAAVADRHVEHRPDPQGPQVAVAEFAGARILLGVVRQDRAVVVERREIAGIAIARQLDRLDRRAREGVEQVPARDRAALVVEEPQPRAADRQSVAGRLRDERERARQVAAVERVVSRQVQQLALARGQRSIDALQLVDGGREAALEFVLVALQGRLLVDQRITHLVEGVGEHAQLAGRAVDEPRIQFAAPDGLGHAHE